MRNQQSEPDGRNVGHSYSDRVEISSHLRTEASSNPAKSVRSYEVFKEDDATLLTERNEYQEANAWLRRCIDTNIVRTSYCSYTGQHTLSLNCRLK